MEQYQTETGRREDLEQLETNPYLGFIGGQVMPPVEVQTKQGKVYYQTLTSDSTAETGRSQGTAPSRTFLTKSSQDWSASEVIKRYAMERDEVKQYGGVEVADRVGGMASKRSVERALEEAIAKDVLTNSSATVDDIQDSFLKTAQTGLKAIHRYPGEKALVCSYSVFHRLMRYDEIKNRFDLSSVALSGQNARDIVQRQPAALEMALAAIIGVDRVLVGDDDQWYDADSDMEQRVALMALPNTESFSHTMDPVFGKQFVYLPDGQNRYFVESFYDDDDKTNNYDAAAYYSNEVFNTGALYLLDGIDEGNATTTTTT